ncbi:MAG: CDP-diacylglycerol--glycerol-3-phosphate 3-phosphatidyltransferase [Solibacterales bacterium]|nr:CDP-diacylglycerol--glycerol-3-phosphate 3-phosphatidyltransferase [Bryobacterales bacterium]
MINLPNTLTVLRIFFVPLLLAVMLQRNVEVKIGGIPFNTEWLALVIFLAAAGTDLLDGYLARRRHQVTTFGKLADPLADKLLISAAFICLVELDRVPAWMVFIIVGREFAVTGLRGIALSKGYTIAASDLGKTKMVIQVVAVSLLMIEPYSPVVADMAYLTLWAAVLFATWSAVDYCRTFWLSLGEQHRRKSSGKLATLDKTSKHDLIT